MVRGGEKHLAKQTRESLDSGLQTFCFLNLIFLFLQQRYHTYCYCGLRNIPDCAAWSFETASGAADFTSWGGGFLPFKSPVSNAAPISFFTALKQKITPLLFIFLYSSTCIWWWRRCVLQLLNASLGCTAVWTISGLKKEASGSSTVKTHYLVIYLCAIFTGQVPKEVHFTDQSTTIVLNPLSLWKRVHWCDWVSQDTSTLGRAKLHSHIL